MEGVSCSEYVADVTAEVFDAFTLEEIIDWMTVYNVDDPLGTAGRQFSGAESDFFTTLDNFVSMGKYTDENRQYCVDEYRMNPVIAEMAAELIS